MAVFFFKLIKLIYTFVLYKIKHYEKNLFFIFNSFRFCEL